MDELINRYSDFLFEYLSKSFANSKTTNPYETNEERFRAKAIFISLVLYLKYGKKEAQGDNLIENADQWLKSNFGESNLLSLVIAQSDIWFASISYDDIQNLITSDLHIPTLYESLLAIESLNENDKVTVSSAKNYRNKLGSYYTPSHFAKKVTKSTIDLYLKRNFGSISKNKDQEQFLSEIIKTTFVDFSCGGGNFLLQILNYFRSYFKKLGIGKTEIASLVRRIALNISAFDVDCLALEVAKITLLLEVKEPSLYNKVSQNFHHANFLIHADQEISQNTRESTFKSGFIYHSNLSLNRKELKEYDVILGNPPWEKIRFEEKKFYAQYSRTVTNDHFKSSRKDQIRSILEADPLLQKFSHEFENQLIDCKQKIKNDPFFSLSNSGELNTYALFTEAAINLKSDKGVIGLILKSGIVTSQINKRLFGYMVNERLIETVYDFINKKKIFNIDSRERFCFLLFSSHKPKKFSVAMNLTDINQIDRTEMTILNKADLKLVNPITLMLPNFNSPDEANFLVNKAQAFPFLKDEYPSTKFGRIVHFTSHAESIVKHSEYGYLPIYEGKFFNQFDAKYSGFNGVQTEARYGNKSSSVLLDSAKKGNSDYVPESRFYIDKKKWEGLSKNYSADYMLAWRSLTSATNKRSCIATILPFVPASQSVQFLIADDHELLYLAGLFNSVIFDFFVKTKMNGIDLTQSIINQIPVPRKNTLEMKILFDGKLASFKQHIDQLVASLLVNDARLQPLLNRNNMADVEESLDRSEAVKKIDLLFLSLYDIIPEQIDLILNHFGSIYSKEDAYWLKKNLLTPILNDTVSTARATPTTGPIR